MAKKRQGKFASQAALDAIVRYGPEQSALQALVAQAYANRKTGIQTARQTARGVTGAIVRATPQAAADYDAAGLRQAQAAEKFQADTAGLSPVADSIKAALSGEAAGAQQRLAASKASTLADLRTQKVQAQRGKQFAIQHTQDDFVSAISDVLQRQQGLAREMGAFEASTTGSLRKDAAERRQNLQIAMGRTQQQERNSLRTAGIDPDTGKLLPKAKLDREKLRLDREKAAKRDGKSKPTGADRDAAADFGKAMTWLKTLDNQKLQQKQPDAKARRRSIGQILVMGNAENRIPAIPQVLVTAANDMHFDGHLSPNTVKQLHEAGYRVRGLPGVKTRRDLSPEELERQRRANKRPAASGQTNLINTIINKLR